MKRIVPVLAGFLLLASSGFAAASIFDGRSLAAMLTTTGSTGTAPTETTSNGRKVALCHATGSKKKPFVTIRVSERAVPAHLRRGDRPGACTSDEPAKAKKKDDPSAAGAKKKKKGAEPSAEAGVESESKGKGAKEKEKGAAGGKGKGK